MTSKIASQLSGSEETLIAREETEVTAREKKGGCVLLSRAHTHFQVYANSVPNVGDGVSFPFRLYRGRWKAESFMKVHRVPVVTHLSRCSEGGNGRERERGRERGKVLLVSRSSPLPRYRELSFRSFQDRSSSRTETAFEQLLR